MGDRIRMARPDDSAAILCIYTPYVLNTAVSFETQAPTVEEYAQRIRSITSQYPFLVYESDKGIVAYAYASKHRERGAYCYDVDVSVYAMAEYHGSGIANKLYSCLFQILKAQGFHNAYAAYTLPNEKSMGFHAKHGFRTIGTFHNTGYKLGKWHDVQWAEKSIAPCDGEPGQLQTIVDLPPGYLQGVYESAIRE